MSKPIPSRDTPLDFLRYELKLVRAKLLTRQRRVAYLMKRLNSGEQP